MARTGRNLARESSATVGTGITVDLAGAVDGFVSFHASGAVDGDQITYSGFDKVNNTREIGFGRYFFDSNGPSISRDTPVISTNANSRINLSGTSEWVITKAAEDLDIFNMLDLIGSTRGMILVRGASAWAGKALGVSGGVFSSDGTDAVWRFPSNQAQAGGRLTLSSTKPIMVADVASATDIYYLPYKSVYLPIGDGAILKILPDSGLSLALDNNSGHTGYHQAGKNFFLFYGVDNGETLRLGTGPAWTGDRVIGTGAGTSELQFLGAVPTNKNTMNLKFGPLSGDVASMAPGTAVCIGMFRASADGTTKFTARSTPASGGTDNFLGLWNAFNRERIRAICQDTASWSYASGTIRQANGSSSNRISWVDGFQQSDVEVKFSNSCYNNSTVSNNTMRIGIGLNNTTVFDGTSVYLQTGVDVGQPAFFATAFASYYPQLGFNTLNANEASSASGGVTFGNLSNQQMCLQVDLMM